MLMSIREPLRRSRDDTIAHGCTRTGVIFRDASMLSRELLPDGDLG